MPGQHSSFVPVATSHRRQPPDYSSRRVKLRLFVTLAIIMLVAALVERTWTHSKRPAASADKPFNNRLQNEPRTSHDPAGTFVAMSDSKSAAAHDDATTVDPVGRTLQLGWKEIFTHLTEDERDRLFKLLDTAARRKTLSVQQNDSINELLEKIARLWDDFDLSARASLSDAPEADRAIWSAVLENAASRFDRQIGQLKTVADGGDLSDDPTKNVAEAQSLLATIARDQIQDDTPILRPAERQIWFYEFARLVRQPADDAADESPTRVGYLQLSRQPSDYRGRLVAIKGNVRRAYRSAAGENHLGIKEYCVYWLYPAGGPDAPIVVYALEAPPGFPKLAQNPQAARNNLHEDVEITGVFFKRCAYAGQGGTYTAPLLLAAIPSWQPSPPPFAAAPSPNLVYELGGAAVAALIIALCVTAVLWKRSASKRTRVQSLSAASLVDLSRSATSASPGEYFRTLQQQEGGDK